MGEKPVGGENVSGGDLEDIYRSDKAWLESMAYYTPVFYEGFKKLTLGILGEGAIPSRIKELILACVYAFQGFTDGAELHMKNAIELGASDEEVAEMLAALVLSRGPRIYFEGLKVWKKAGGKPKSTKLHSDSSGQSSSEERMLNYFEDYYGSTLPHIRALAENRRLEVLEGYYEMRRFCLSDTVLPQKYKEFLYIAVNAADMRPEAMELHVKGAYKMGVSKEEILEAMLLGIMAGGVASWLYASIVFENTAK